MDDGKITMITTENVRNDIVNLLEERFELSEEYIRGREEDNFIGLQGLLGPRELTYLAYVIEQSYGIRFSMKEYDDSRFYCLSGLSEIITERLKTQFVR